VTVIPDVLRPLQNLPFRPISASASNCNPRNSQCMPVVKIFVFPSGALTLRAGGLNLNKNEYFSKVSFKAVFLLRFNQNGVTVKDQS